MVCDLIIKWCADAGCLIRLQPAKKGAHICSAVDCGLHCIVNSMHKYFKESAQAKGLSSKRQCVTLYSTSELSSKTCIPLQLTFVHKFGLVTGTFLLQHSCPCRQVQLDVLPASRTVNVQ
eukprot:1150961-Pelagomonas_calceolata.AAC.1